jgi:WD40 repeat protein
MLIVLVGSVSASVILRVGAQGSITPELRALAYSPDGTTLAVGGSFGINLYHTNLQSFLSLQGNTGSVTSLAWSPDGHKLVSGNLGNIINIWDVQAGTQLSALAGHTAQVTAVGWSPDGQKIASASLDGTVRIWNAQNGNLLATLQNPDQVWTLAWSPDSSSVAAGGGDANGSSPTFIRIWNVATAAPRLDLVVQGTVTNVVIALAWSPNGTYLLSAAGGAQLWNAQTGQFVREIPSTNTISAVAWRPDSNAVVVASVQPEILGVDITTQAPLYSFLGPWLNITALAWSPDGTQVSSVSLDGTIRTWAVSTGLQIAFAASPATISDDLALGVSFCVDNADYQQYLQNFIHINQISNFLNSIQTNQLATITPQCLDELTKMANELVNLSITPTFTSTATNTPTKTPTPTLTPSRTNTPRPTFTATATATALIAPPTLTLSPTCGPKHPCPRPTVGN